MKILVTGGAGYIGGTVAGLLAENGHEAVVFDNLSHGRRDLLPAGVEFVEGELADRPALENLFASAKDQGKPFDAVLHFAALIEAGESMVHPEQFFRNNTASTLSLLEAILAEGPRRLVFSSTAAVYGETEVMRNCFRQTPTGSQSCWSSGCWNGFTVSTACVPPLYATST
jgi:UDP-glucose 4-epimerase